MDIKPSDYVDDRNPRKLLIQRRRNNDIVHSSHITMFLLYELQSHDRGLEHNV